MQPASLLHPLYEALKTEVLASAYLHADETPIKVLNKDKNNGVHRGYYWVYQESRGREWPSGILENFNGYLQTDGYTVYEAFDKSSQITVEY